MLIELGQVYETKEPGCFAKVLKKENGRASIRYYILSTQCKDFTINDEFSNWEVIQAHLGTEKLPNLGPLVKILPFFEFIFKFFDQQKGQILEIPDNQKTFFCRYLLQKGRVEFIGHEKDNCTCLKGSFQKIDIYQCSCKQIFHKECFLSGNKNCFNCYPLVQLKKRDVSSLLTADAVAFNFDLKGLKNKFCPEDSPEKISSEINSRSPDFLLKTTGLKDEMLNLWDKERINLLSEGKERIRIGCQDKIFTIFIEALESLKTEGIEDFLNNPHSSEIARNLNNCNTPQLFACLKCLVFKLEKDIYEWSLSENEANNIYIEKMKILLHYLSQTSKKNYVIRYINGILTTKNLWDLREEELIDQNFKDKIGTTRGRYLEDRMAEKPPILVKTHNNEFYIDIEKVQNDIILTNAQIIRPCIESFKAQGTKIIPESYALIQTKLFKKIREVLDIETANLLIYYINFFN